MKTGKYALSIALLCILYNLVLFPSDNIYASSFKRDSDRGYYSVSGSGQGSSYFSSQDETIKEFSKIADLKQEQAKEFSKIADLKQKQAQKKNTTISKHYNQGRAHYASNRYMEAKASFEQILEIEPSYEPAKLFLQSVIIQEVIVESRKRIESIKMQLADIMVSYDKRVQRTDRLAVKYFLELAQKECQIGNFQAAEKYYNLCYKVHPYGKEDIEWFVKITHDMMLLYNKLDEENTRMEELIASLR